MRLDPKNPMTRVLRTILGFEAITFGLAIPGMIQVSDRSLAASFGWTVPVILLALLAAGTLARPFGYPLAWLTQAAGMALGVLTPWMFWVGAAFAGLWWVTFVLGKRIAPGESASGARG